MRSKYRLFFAGFLAFLLVPLLVIYTSAEQVTYQLNFIKFFTEADIGFQYEDGDGNVISDGFTRANDNITEDDAFYWYDLGSSATLEGGGTFAFAEFLASDPSDYTASVGAARGQITTTFPLMGDPDSWGKLITGQNIQIAFAFMDSANWFLTLNVAGCYVTYEDPDGRMVSLKSNTSDSWQDDETTVLFTTANMYDEEGNSYPTYVMRISDYALSTHNLHYGGQYHITFYWNARETNTYITNLWVGMETSSYISIGSDGQLPPSDTIPDVTTSAPVVTFPPGLSGGNESIQAGADTLIKDLQKVTAPPIQFAGALPDFNVFGLNYLWKSDYGKLLVSLCVFGVGFSVIGFAISGRRS